MLGGGNNYSAGTTIRAGTLEALSPGSLPGNSTPGLLSVASGATLAVNTSFWLSPDIQALTGNTTAFASGSTLGFDTAGGDASYGYAITNSGLGIVKLGANTLTLTAANSYTGPTTIAPARCSSPAAARSARATSPITAPCCSTTPAARRP